MASVVHILVVTFGSITGRTPVNSGSLHGTMDTTRGLVVMSPVVAPMHSMRKAKAKGSLSSVLAPLAAPNVATAGVETVAPPFEGPMPKGPST